MISVDLLPKRYRNIRDLERFLLIAAILFTIMFLAIAAVNAYLTIQTKHYQAETAALQKIAQQYQLVNRRFAELQEVEDRLQHRLDLARPLLAQDDSIVPVLNLFSGPLPQNAWLTQMDLSIEGQMHLEGEALAYSDVAAYIKWLEEYRGLVVNLKATAFGEKTVLFSIDASITGQGGVE